MEIKLTNIGAVANANVNVDDKITIICGDNATGKSIVCKSLYATLAAWNRNAICTRASNGIQSYQNLKHELEDAYDEHFSYNISCILNNDCGKIELLNDDKSLEVYIDNDRVSTAQGLDIFKFSDRAMLISDNNIWMTAITKELEPYPQISERTKELFEIGQKYNDEVLTNSYAIQVFYKLAKYVNDGSMHEGSYLILDNADASMHPKMQIQFAELIALLKKDLGFKIIVTTHSPYFLRALQVYSAKYLDDECEYYLAEQINDNQFEIRQIDDLEHVYNEMFAPFQQLDDDTNYF